MGHDPIKQVITCTHFPRYFETPGALIWRFLAFSPRNWGHVPLNRQVDLDRSSRCAPGPSAPFATGLGDQAFFGGAAPHFGEFFLFAALDALRQTDPSTAAKAPDGSQEKWITMDNL